MIYGDRVRLRCVERDDLPQFVKWLNDPEVRDGLATLYPLGMAEEERWFEENLKLEPARRALAIDALPGPDDLSAWPGSWSHIGGTGFHQVDWRNHWAELGIAIGSKESWNHGYGTDATRTMVRWAFQELNLNRVFVRVYEYNAGAIRCYQKVGFKPEGRLRQDRFHRGRYYDTLLMGLLRDEFTARFGSDAGEAGKTEPHPPRVL